MEFQKEESEEILNIFREESKEIIASMYDKLLSLEKEGFNLDTSIGLFRDAHSLKGSARMLGFVNIQNIAHKIEDVISLIKEEKLSVTSEINDIVSGCLDYISTLINKTVENKQEYISDDYNSYIEKLALIENNSNAATSTVEKSSLKEEIRSLDDNCMAQNCLIDILYTIELSKKEKNQSYVYEIENKVNKLISALADINSDAVKFLKIQAGKLLGKIEKFKISENKDISFKDVYEAIKALIDLAIKYFDESKIERKNFYDVVSQMLIAKQGLCEKEDKNDSENNKAFVENNSNQNQNELDFLQRVPLLEINVEFFQDAILIIEKLIEENHGIKKEIYKDVKEILDVFKEHNATSTRDITIGLKEIIEGLNSSKKEDIIETKTKADVIKKMVKFQYRKEAKKTPAIKHELSQKDILNSITNTEIKTLRIDSVKLDNLVGQIGELIVSKIKTNEQLSLAKKINNDLVDWQKNFSKMSYYIKYFDKKYLSKPEKETSSDFRKMIAYNKQLSSLCEAHSNRINSLIKEMSNLFRQLQESETKLNSTSNEIETMVKNMRILPLSTIFQLFPRMVHNIAKDKNKKIDIEIKGADVTADKTIIEEIKIPLMHIIRNSIDHGIEDVETRKALGKNPVGKIEIDAQYKDNTVIIDVKDDGRGLDIEKIKLKAFQKGLLTKEEIAGLNDEELTNLIFYPGFSTEDNVTELSGRGLGLDIVNNKINQLSGRIDIFSQVNIGMVVRVILPATVATKKVFIIEEASQLFAIETSVIKTIVRISSEQIFEKDNENYYIHNGSAIIIYTLSQILNIENTPKETNKYTLMIIETESTIFGVIVEKLLSDQEIVHKKLAPPLYKVKNISGITTLANGQACLILSVSDIISTLSSAKLKTKIISKNGILKTKDNSKYKILVVDDSHTTRILQKNILSNYGYNVITATSPVNALEKMKENVFDLIISDVQMPEMSGFEFIEKIREIKEYKNTPVIIVSSEPKEKYEEKIEKLEISNYIPKSAFRQNEFVETIEKILNKQ